MRILTADTGVLTRNVDLKPNGIRPRAIKVSPLLQVFDADSLSLLAEVPVGHRRLQSTVGSHCSLSSLHPTYTRFYVKFTLWLTWRKPRAIYFGLASPPIIPGPMSIRSSGVPLREHDYGVLLGSDGLPATRFGWESDREAQVSGVIASRARTRPRPHASRSARPLGG